MVASRVLNEAASGFERRLEVLTAEITSRMQKEVLELGQLEAPEMWEVVRQVTLDGRRIHAEHLRQGCVLPGSIAEPDRQAVHAAVHAGMSVAGVLQAFRIGHSSSWEVWLDVTEALDVADSERPAVLRNISRFAIAYDDRLMNMVAEEFELELRRTAASPSKRRMKVVRDLIEGVVDEAPELEYPMEIEHLGVIAWGSDALATLQGLRDALNRQLLWAEVQESLLVGWLGSGSSLEPGWRRALVAFAPVGDGSVAIGSPGFGVEGFRNSHRQAGEAHVVARRLGGRVTVYDEVAFEALALRDEPAAREVVASVLAGLDAPEARTEQLRETLRAYFAAHQNAASAASALGVHEQTVARRLRSIEEMTGSPVHARSAELELALRLDYLL
jgi:hypothetical protein